MILDAQRLCDAIIGRWDVQRIIARDGVIIGNANGVAIATQDISSVLYHENIVATLHSKQFNGTRRYKFSIEHDALYKSVIENDQEILKHQILFVDEKAIGMYTCVRDLYKSEYIVHDNNSYTLHYDITTPTAHNTLITKFTRTKLNLS